MVGCAAAARDEHTGDECGDDAHVCTTGMDGVRFPDGYGMMAADA
jgi:hypothetical protein